MSVSAPSKLDFPTRMYIDGAWREGTGGKTLPVINPADESVVADVAWAEGDEPNQAIEAAAKAFATWKNTSAYERAKILKKTAELIRERADHLARAMTMEQGKPLPEAKAETLATADTYEWFAEEAKRAYGRTIPATTGTRRHYAIKHPVGVVGTITPWNFPAALASRKIAAALAAGCTVVSRPAEQTPITLILQFECLVEAGVPKGVANLVIGPPRPFADALFAHPAVRKISFTGSTNVGKELIRRSADHVKRLSLELGGHAPLIVFPDANVEQVAQAAVIGKFRNNGQVCVSPSRFYIHDKIVKDFTEAAVELTKKLKLGNGLEEGVQVGPMFAPQGLEKAERLIDDAHGKGAHILTGGGRSKRFEKGYWFEPTILNHVDGSMRLLTEEPFAPVMPILDFSKLDDVIAAANATPYGLAAYVFTNDLTVATRMAEGLEAGIIGINDPVPATPQCPFGGMKESGLGREMSVEGLEAYFETKYVSVGLRQS
ncbi:NAD-dependent succinate-semialdehyde dehydrogenase [Paludisphaera rhizosphaerae]|uniref:NAD-dependent succinate-semialdehyde dehydrogenase n=1 Tax=Paludisphaera rhizosphaerae TaxID=2711216 RepID=UPI001F0D6D19|nr:NAD-dependent succinate-semialdehyde dehydrogenase [Paludisphaera rhizosphaerae]